MDFIDEIKALATRIPKQLEHLQTEEATKNALIMPFINALGYNVFDPTEVMPEFTADVGTKKGEKVDYAIMKDGKPIILFECKRASANLDDGQASQLFRYFATTDARFGVLTDGILYRFYSDLEDPNKMDAKPFLEFNMQEIDDATVGELKRFTKSAFDLEEMIAAAGEMKYTKEIKRILGEELRNPSEDFVRFFAKQVYSGLMTKAVREQFTQLTKQAFQHFINDRISDRLKSALEREAEPPGETQSVPEKQATDNGYGVRDDRGIITTQDEHEGYLIVKAILREVVAPDRVAMRDTKSYCGILFDDNRRKPICRLHFNTSQKYLGLFNEERNEERISIEGLDDIFQYGERLKNMVRLYADG